MRKEPIVLTRTGEMVYLFGMAISLSLILFASVRLFGYLVIWVSNLI